MLLRAILALLLAMAGTWAQAVPSACGALWGTSGTNLAYYNAASSSWITAASMGVTGNALGGYEGDGSLYFISQVTLPQTMYKAQFSNTTGTMTVAQVSAANISVPSQITYTTNTGTQATTTLTGVIGATFDRDTSNRRMFLYAATAVPVTSLPVNGSTTGSSPLGVVGLLDPEVPTAVSWSVVYQTTATNTVTYPLIGNSGDIFADQQTGALWIVTNSAPNRMLKLNLNYSGYQLNSVQVVGTATIQVGGVGLGASQAAVGVEPQSGVVYIASSASTTTWALTDHRTNPVVAAVTTASQGVSDAGNCVAPADPPSIDKSFNPTTATAPGTSVLTITITNPNKVPIWTTKAVTDTFPTAMSVYTTPSLQGACFSDGVQLATRPPSATMTAPAGATKTVIASGALIPGGANGGSCSFSVVVSATIANLYNNTIPAGSLTSTAGSNTDAASASFTVQNVSLPNAPAVVKSFTPTTSSAASTGTTTLTIIITNPNTISNTLTSALVDNFPSGLRMGAPSPITISCFSNGVAVTRPSATTATTATSAFTVANNSVIPGGALPAGGSCSFSVQVRTTVTGAYLNTIPVGSLTTRSGSNPDAATASFSLRSSDFQVFKYQQIGVGGATTSAVIDVPSGNTIVYTISIRNTAGVNGTRTYSDSIPSLVTPVLSITAVPIGGAGCTTRTVVAAGVTTLSGTVSNAPLNGGCDISVLAKASTTGVVSTVTNSVGIYTVTGTLDSDTSDNTATVVLTIKPATFLTITKDDGRISLLTGATNSYTITIANLGPAAADGAVLKDEAATGLNCTDVSCAASGGAVCPLPAQLFVSALQSNTGVAIGAFPSGSTVTFVLSCSVTATGEP